MTDRVLISSDLVRCDRPACVRAPVPCRTAAWFARHEALAARIRGVWAARGFGVDVSVCARRGIVSDLSNALPAGVDHVDPAPAAIALFCPPSKVSAVLSAVAAETGLSVADLIGPGTTDREARARFIACARLRALGLGLVRIGQHLGGRDHTTILHALRRHAEIEAAKSRAVPVAASCRSKKAY